MGNKSFLYFKSIFMKNFCIFILGILMFGCSKIEIYDDKDLNPDNKTGIKFYAPKPYILVSRTGNSDNPLSVEVIYLPDLNNEYYARSVSGLGASKLSMTFSNGILTTFGQENDPKINELISSISGVPGLLAAAEKARREADQIAVQTGLLVDQSTNLVALGKKLENIAKDLDKLKDEYSYPGLSNNNKQAVHRAVNKFLTISKDMRVPGASSKDALAQIQQEFNNLKNVSPTQSNIPENEKTTWRLISQSKSEIQKIINELTPKQPEKPTLTLYEIRIDSSGTHLIEVPFNQQAINQNAQ